MKELSKLPKSLRTYFYRIALWSVAIWLGGALLCAVLIDYVLGFLCISKIGRDVGFLGVIFAGIIQAAVDILKVYRHACGVAREIETKQ